MNFESLIEELGTSESSAIIGLTVGVLFGVFAQQSRFCLRAACVEFWRGKIGPKFSVWLLAFSAALIGTQINIENGLIDTSNIRQLNAVGSLSGAIIGGLLFGSGMILARGCASRLLVLSATGNMRALISGLVITVVAQASLRGVLSPTRESISSVWLLEGHQRGFSHYLPHFGGILLGITILSLGLWYAKKYRVSPWITITSVLTGLCIVLGWSLTSWLADNSFDIVQVKSISFTGPSADTLMGLINQPALPYTFDIGLVPGVFLGSFVAAIITREFKWQQFTQETKQSRYLIGASMMGFGSMLAGGCAVGAGVTGGALLSITAWLALFCMWLGAGATDWLVDRPRNKAVEN
jgi:uncharacterized protein